MLSPAASIEDGRLVLRASAPGALAGQPFAPDAFRDVIVDAVVSLVRGGTDDAYGIFVRQVAERSYLAFMVTPDGTVPLLMVADGASAPMVEGRLPVEAPFARGLGAANRLTVVAAGPCLTCIVNGFVVAGVTVDARYKAGLAGTLLVHLAAEPAEAVVGAPLGAGARAAGGPGLGATDATRRVAWPPQGRARTALPRRSTSVTSACAGSPLNLPSEM